MYNFFNSLNDIVVSLDKINNSLNQTNWIEILITVFSSFLISIITIFLTLRYERKSTNLIQQENINSLLLSDLNDALKEHSLLLFSTPTEIESNYRHFCKLFGINHFEKLNIPIITNEDIRLMPESKRYLKYISKYLGDYANELSYLFKLEPLLERMDDSSVLYSDITSILSQVKVFEKEVFNLAFLLHDAMANAEVSSYPEHIMAKLDKSRDFNKFIKDYNNLFYSERIFKDSYEKLIRQSKVDVYREI